VVVRNMTAAAYQVFLLVGGAVVLDLLDPSLALIGYAPAPAFVRD
jgi:hypothetical protein